MFLFATTSIDTVHIPTDAQLHRTFKSRLLDMAANVQNNNTKLAHYLAELLVSDYGTHVITSDHMCWCWWLVYNNVCLSRIFIIAVEACMVSQVEPSS